MTPLLDGMTYMIDTYPGTKCRKCCDMRHPVSGDYGDTSFGLQGGWYGKVDILVTCKNEELLPVFIGESIDDEILETDENIVDNSLDQIMAEAIVFSFFQRKQFFGRLKHNLIPSIGIISGKLIVFMYDCENDVLLGSSVMALLNQGGIAVSSVIVLWLVLNYKLFGTGLIYELKDTRQMCTDY